MRLRLALCVLGLIGLTCGCCGVPLPDGARWFSEQQAQEEMVAVLEALSEQGFTYGWIQEGEVAWVYHPEMSGKVVLRCYPSLKVWAAIRTFPKKKKKEVTNKLLMHLNYENATGYVKVYLDKDNDLWTQAFLSYDGGVNTVTLRNFIVNFDVFSVSAAEQFKYYIDIEVKKSGN